MSLSLSLPLNQVLLHFHLQYKATDRSYTKGDFIFRTANVVEMVTKTHSIIQEGQKRKLKVTFSNEYVHNYYVIIIILVLPPSP